MNREKARSHLLPKNLHQCVHGVTEIFCRRFQHGRVALHRLCGSLLTQQLRAPPNPPPPPARSVAAKLISSHIPIEQPRRKAEVEATSTLLWRGCDRQIEPTWTVTPPHNDVPSRPSPDECRTCTSASPAARSLSAWVARSPGLRCTASAA
jgi:hypothetical protein